MKMPIVNQLIQNDSLQTKNPCRPQERKFEAMLKENAYYRNHQKQWEKSELKFEQPCREKPSSVQANSVISHKKSLSAEPPFYPQTKPCMQLKEPMLSLQEDQPVQTIKIPFENGKWLNKTTESFTAYLEQLKSTIDEILRQSETLLPAREKSSVKFSNHQLFIDGQTARLALQTAGLSKNEIKSLITTVKNLLKQRKITLTEILIDGEHYD